MIRTDDFGQTSALIITVLVDNRADLLVKSTDTVRRFTKAPLLAEHGFAALVELSGAPPAGGQRILWDAGRTRFALLHNAEQRSRPRRHRLPDVCTPDRRVFLLSGRRRWGSSCLLVSLEF